MLLRKTAHSASLAAASRAIIHAAAALALALAPACAESPRPRPRPAQAPRVQRDVPAILTRTIGAEATLRGAQPILVSGYGIVVGLNGTGSSDVHPGVRAMLEREMTRRGVGRESMGMSGTTPSQMIDDPNTAVVLVEGVIPAGAPEGALFDVRVRALPGSSTTSIEGGHLWTTDLRIGLVLPGGPDTQPLAEASGDIFINPFADPAQTGDDSVNRTVGRILDGGVVTDARNLVLALDNPSHSRARSIVATINTRFTQRRPQDKKPTARGSNEELIEINVPAAYADRTEEFMQLLLATRVDLAFSQEAARRYAMALRDQPELATEVSWRLQALGPEALPFLRELYDYAEPTPRLASLRAGARLGDALSAPHLKDIARNGPAPLRTTAIELLADLGPDPQINRALHELLDATQLEVRLAAYEGLAARRDPSLNRTNIEGKFLLDQIPAKGRMIYVSQQGEPRIVIFGAGLTLKRPVLVSGWSDRLMVAADTSLDDIRVFYRDHRRNTTSSNRIKPEVSEFIEYLAHKQTPEEPAPGLDFSYSEVVGALHQVWKGGGIEADFVAEQDRLAAELLRSLETLQVEDRPETSDPAAAPPDRPGSLSPTADEPSKTPAPRATPSREPSTGPAPDSPK